MGNGRGIAWTKPMQMLAGLMIASAILSGSDGAAAFQDEDIRREALNAIFPGFSVSEQRGVFIDATRAIGRSDHALTFPDAFKAERVYRVTGPPVVEPEYCAAAIRGTDKATTRDLRFQLYRWPVGSVTELLGVLQYRFPQAHPPGFCTSVGLLVHLAGSTPAFGLNNSERHLLETFAVDAWRHISLQSVRMVDVTGDGRDDLLVESDIRKASADVSDLYVFDLSGGRFDLILRQPVRMYGEVPMLQMWHQTLDIPRTLRQRGKKLCFEKVTYADRNQRLATPRVTHPCYPRGRGVMPR